MTADIADERWEKDCERLSMTFANAIDRRDYDRLLAIFTEDGVVERWGNRIEGKDALRTWLQGRPEHIDVRHVCTNFSAQKISATEVRGVTYFIFFSKNLNEPPPETAQDAMRLMGEYLDTFVLQSGQWKLKMREIKLLFGKV